MDSRIMKLEIKKSNGDEDVSFVIPDLNNATIKMTDSNVDDIENLFNLIFEAIIRDKKSIEFKLSGEKSNDLFYEIAEEIVKQLNSEINNSINDFERIIALEELI